MKKMLIATMLLLSLSSTVSAQTAKSPPPVKYDYVIIHGADLNDVSAKLNAKLLDGYEILSAVAQSVSTSVNSRNNTNQAYDTPYRDIKGEVMYVLRKKR